MNCGALGVFELGRSPNQIFIRHVLELKQTGEMLSVCGRLLATQRGLLLLLLMLLLSLDDLFLDHASLDDLLAQGHLFREIGRRRSVARASGHGSGAAVDRGRRIQKAISPDASRLERRVGTMKNAAKRARGLTELGMPQLLDLSLTRRLMLLKGHDALDGIVAERLVLLCLGSASGRLIRHDAIAHRPSGELGLHDSIVGVANPHELLLAASQHRRVALGGGGGSVSTGGGEQVLTA
mmetsp:Transcript_27597/g.46991  ORF Transcript_27597/g.46991 Transcript_27597/m.46991 type:complete len:238 (+) Transcript_27597:2064-2777(+)